MQKVKDPLVQKDVTFYLSEMGSSLGLGTRPGRWQGALDLRRGPEIVYILLSRSACELGRNLRIPLSQ